MISKHFHCLSLLTVFSATLITTGCGRTIQTDGPITAVEQQELDDQLQMLHQLEQKKR